MSKTYSLVYEIQIVEDLGEGFSHEYVMKKSEENPNIVACDAMLLASIVRLEDGQLFVQFHYKDPKYGESNLELFKIWALLGDSIRQRDISEKLNKSYRFILEVVDGLIKQGINDAKEKEASNGCKNEETV